MRRTFEEWLGDSTWSGECYGSYYRRALVARLDDEALGVTVLLVDQQEWGDGGGIERASVVALYHRANGWAAKEKVVYRDRCHPELDRPCAQWRSLDTVEERGEEGYAVNGGGHCVVLMRPTS